ncbi:hypothetical protein [Nocardia niigatensis]|uniref:hypothetical protein n=1 Tax=Nocardia niigatensis TaxID=209249 RepID=UPI000594225C|nr:hypothetical protein [Nocardia niigatensis]
MITSLLPICDELSADRIAYMDVDLVSGEWYEVTDVGGKMMTGLVLVAFRMERMAQKVTIRGGSPEAVQYLDVSDTGSILRWHAENYPSVRAEIWLSPESDEGGFARKGLIASSGDSVDMVVIERTDVDGDLISEEFHTAAELIERVEYRYNSDKEIIETRTYDRHGANMIDGR